MEVRKIRRYLPENQFTDSPRLRSLTIFHGHHRPVHHPLFVCHFYAPITPKSYLCPSSVLKYKRRNAESSRIPNLVVFSIIVVLSLVGAIGLVVRAASRGGRGLCEDFAPGNCTVAVVAMTLTWVSVVIGTPSTFLALYLVGLTIRLASAGLVVSWLDKSSRTALMGGPHDPEGPEKEPERPRQSWSNFRSSLSYTPGPTSSYVPRPRDPYDAPRRRRSDRSQSHQNNPRRVPSNRAPVPSLPSLPSFHPVGLETDTVAARRINRREPNRTRPDERAQEDLSELPPPTRRPPVDPETAEIRKMRHISPTDLYAQMGG